MNEVEVIEIARTSIIVLIKVSGPFLFISLAVGLSIALVQALTQVQEMTLVFVPKIIAIFLTLLFAIPFLGATMSNYTEYLFERIVNSGLG